ncbi:magnesium transporter MgtE N-terminal domain-containing protein [Micrococcus sp.]|uniref:magnesium transporter MgtE N-terminal domain-containing protein n=1 Tax=Micrococcus sp. TaxID=1271 RepID=UPI002A915B48|nr:CBS domain-containing protein [Micrococcus sp.]MDY6054575.1 CBS domain-containing protein [Micrococcus sp.]
MNSPKVFVARLLGLDVFDPLGDRLGRLRDVVVLDRGPAAQPAATGLVIEVPGKKRVFVPMTRVTSMDSGQIITTGLINLRRFSRRGAEQTVAGDLFDRRVRFVDGSGEAVIEDIGLERQRNGDWLVSELYVCRATGGRSAFRRPRGEHLLVDWDEVRWSARAEPQGATSFVAAHEDLKAADLADMLHDMSEKRRVEVANELQDERLADVMQELPDDDQVQILSQLDDERAADVLEEMDPDDAADLLNELPEVRKEQLLGLMEPDDADDVRRLLEYEEDTVGSVMTTVPVVLPPEATVAEAMATIRQQEISPALASLVIVARPPLETPTGRYLGVVHFQRLLRYPPPEAIGNIMDKDLEPVTDMDSVVHVTRELATYNLTCIPVVNAQQRVVGAVSVDDVLDHILPEDWRAMDPEDHPATPV